MTAIDMGRRDLVSALQEPLDLPDHDRADDAARVGRPMPIPMPLRAGDDSTMEVPAAEPLAATMRQRSKDVADRCRRAIHDHDPAASARLRDQGKLTARERLTLLFDTDTFCETEALRRHRATGFGLEERRPAGDGVVTGWGKVYGRTVFAFAGDARVFGGSLGEAHATKVHKLMDLALASGAPLVAIHDGAGARVQEGAGALAGYGGIFRRHVAASGAIPQISVILGSCAGGAAYAPALTDFVFLVDGLSKMFVTGPDVVAAVTGECLDLEALGGASIHATRSGVASFVHPDEESCLQDVRYLLGLLPANRGERPPSYECDDQPERETPQLLDLVPADPTQCYDVRGVIEQLVDDGEFLEVQEEWAGNIVCCFGRIAGHTVGFVANQPMVLAGALDISASIKAARFIDCCDQFNVPIVTLVDVPGFLPGSQQEQQGIIRFGAQLIRSYCSATVPRIQVILRKAYGGAYIVMDSPSVGADLSLAWPTNEIAVMGPEAAADVVFRREIANAADPERHRRQLIEKYREECLHPLYAAERGLVDRVIEPGRTRADLADALDMLRNKRRQPTMGPPVTT